MKNLYDATLDAQRQALEYSADTLDRMAVAPERMEQRATAEVGQTPSESVYSENKLELLHYESRTEEQHDVPILVVYALINRPYILDLQPDRSVVATLLDHGFDVYMIDWGEPSRLDASLTLDDYVDRYIANCVDVVRERSGQDAINVLGYCMGGAMSAMYAGLHPEKVRNLALLASGLCFDGTGGVLERWGSEEYYAPKTVTDTFGNVPSDFLDVGFALMDPVDNAFTKYLRLAENLDDEEFVKNFARMETWISDGIDVAGETYRQFLEDIYQDNKLVKNELYLGGKHVDLDRIDMPILQIVGGYDHLIPPEASTPFNEATASEDTTVIEFPSGHIGLSVAAKSHEELWPQVCDWFEQRSQEPDDEEESNVERESATERGSNAQDELTATNEPRVEGERDAEREAAVAQEPTRGNEAKLESIEGIGSAYAQRLRDAGIATPEDLLEADATVAAEVGIAESKLEQWIDRASKRLAEDR